MVTTKQKLDQSKIDRYRKLRRMATHAGGSENERKTALKNMYAMEKKYPHIMDLADKSEKREKIQEGFITPPEPPVDASWFTRKVTELAGWAVDQLQEAQLEVLMQESAKGPIRSFEDELDDQTDLEITDFEAEDGEKCIEIAIAIPVGLWTKVVATPSGPPTFVKWVNEIMREET